MEYMKISGVRPPDHVMDAIVDTTWGGVVAFCPSGLGDDLVSKLNEKKEK